MPRAVPWHPDSALGAIGLSVTGAETCYPWESAEPREDAADGPEDLVAEANKEQLLRRHPEGKEAGQVDGVNLSRTMRTGDMLL